MRRFSLPAVLSLAVLFLLPGTASCAQVTTNDQALQALKSTPPASSAPKPDSGPTASHARHVTHHREAARRPATRLGPAPTMQAAPPANPVILPPPFVMPPHVPPPPPPVPLRADAAGTEIDIPGGTRITFDPDGSDLNPATFGALHAIAAAAIANPAMTISITAWAHGTADDPSTARRLSLNRALAARAVLIAAGVVSSRIRAIAKGMNDVGAGPPDRADIVEILPRAG